VAVKIRMTRTGRHKRPFYRIVAADERAPRDGRYLEVLGTYDPLASPAKAELKTDRLQHWLSRGAQASTTVKRILLRAGIAKPAA
jgi:small subunit ribosomal protein S16